MILFSQWGWPGEQLSTLSGLYSFLQGVHFLWDGCCEAIISMSFFSQCISRLVVRPASIPPWPFCTQTIMKLWKYEKGWLLLLYVMTSHRVMVASFSVYQVWQPWICASRVFLPCAGDLNDVQNAPPPLHRDHASHRLHLGHEIILILWEMVFLWWVMDTSFCHFYSSSRSPRQPCWCCIAT